MTQPTASIRDTWRLTAICSAMHLLVDGLCVCSLYLLSMGLVAQQILAMFIAYNVLAFLTQPLTGALADRMRQRHWLLLASVLLLTLAVLATVAVPRFGLVAEGTMLVAAMLGMGNSLFHVWGGKQVAITTRNDIRALGMFVSTGVLGLSLGYVFFSWIMLCLFLLAISVLAVAYLHGEAQRDAQILTLNSKLSILNSQLSARPKDACAARTLNSQLLTITALLLLMGVVMLRSYVGQGFSLGAGVGAGDGGDLQSPVPARLVLLAGAVSMLGKMSGGWIARRWGIITSFALMVVVAALCFYIVTGWHRGLQIPSITCPNTGMALAILLVGAFAVNCTMPITLYLANAVLPGREGLAFGLLAAALIPGYLLATL